MSTSFQEFGQPSFDVTPDGHFAINRLVFRKRGRALLVQNWVELLEKRR